MSLGQRILQSRQELSLSQRELAQRCGITRNMLSVLEHDRAMPSLQTLMDLSAALNRPVSWLLEEENGAMEAFRAGDYRRCLELCREPGWLTCAALLRSAEAALEEGRFPYARELLERLEASLLQDNLFLPEFGRRAALARLKCGLSAEIAEDGLLLLKARQALSEGRFSDAERYLSAQDDRDEGWELLMSKCLMARKAWQEAAEHLLRCGETGEVCTLLEECYRELEDFKMAYYYAKRSLRSGS